jgi:hypothetical protein
MMFAVILALLHALVSSFQSHSGLALENLALRQGLHTALQQIARMSIEHAAMIGGAPH